MSRILIAAEYQTLDAVGAELEKDGHDVVSMQMTLDGSPSMWIRAISKIQEEVWDVVILASTFKDEDDNNSHGPAEEIIATSIRKGVSKIIVAKGIPVKDQFSREIMGIRIVDLTKGHTLASIREILDEAV